MQIVNAFGRVCLSVLYMLKRVKAVIYMVSESVGFNVPLDT